MSSAALDIDACRPISRHGRIKGTAPLRNEFSMSNTRIGPILVFGAPIAMYGRADQWDVP